METFSSLSILCEGNPPVTGWFPSQRAGNTGFDVFFSYTRLNKPSSCQWLRAPPHKWIQWIWEQRKQETLECLWTPCLGYKKTILLFWCAKVTTELGYIISYTAEHYNDVIMSTIASQITAVSIVCSTVNSCTDERKYKALRHWPLWREFTGDRWIPLTKCQ